MRSGSKPLQNREAGLTMIELLVTMVIMGLAFAVIVGGLSTSILGADIQRRSASADAVLRTIADSVRDDVAVPYVPCAPPGAYSIPPGVVPESGFAVPPPVVKGYWMPDASEPLKDRFVDPAEGTCAKPSDDSGAQLIAISVTPTVRGATQTVQIVKRRP